MIYVVSGLPRSGTSIMMKVLGHCGMHLAWSDEWERILQKKYGGSDYFEFAPQIYRGAGFTRDYDERCVKICVPATLRFPAHPHRMIYMRRSAEAVAESMDKIGIRNGDAMRVDKLQASVERCITVSKDRRSCHSVHQVHLSDFVEAPALVLKTLTGWPLDPSLIDEAAGLVSAANVKNGV